MFLLFGLSALPKALVLFIALHHALLALGFCLLLLDLRCRAPVAAGGALALAWCGTAMSVDSNLHELGAFTALPWLFFFGRRAARHPPLSADLAGVSLSLAWMIFAGNPQMAYLAGISVLPLLLGSPTGSGLLRCAALMALTLLAAAPQLLPTLSHLNDTTREFEHLPASARFAFQTAWSLPPLRLLELFFPFASELDPRNPGWAQPFSGAAGQDQPFLLSNYPGAAFAAPLFLLGLRWFFPPRKTGLQARIYFGMAIVATALALGSHLPLYRIALSALPHWDRFRYPERLMVWVAFAWILAGSLALERALRLRLRPYPFAFVVAPFSLAAIVLAMACPGPGAPSAILRAAGFFGAALLFLAARERARSRAFTFAVALLPALDLLSASPHWIPAQSSAWLSPDSLANLRKITDDLARSQNQLEEGGSRRSFTLDRAGGLVNPPLGASDRIEAEARAKFGHLLFNTGAYWGLEMATGHFVLATQPTLLDKIRSPDLRRRVLDLMSVRYLITMEPNATTVGVNRSASPFVFVPSRIEWKSSDAAVLARIEDLAWNAEGSALLEGPESHASAPGSGWNLARLEKHFDQIQLRLRAQAGSAAGWVVVNENFHANWRATSNRGEPVPIVRANAWAMALPLPASSSGGELVLNLEYKESAFTWGLAGFGIWLLLTFALLAHRVRSLTAPGGHPSSRLAKFGS